MAFSYHPAPNSGPLIQGEFLWNVWEHRPAFPAISVPEGTDIATQPFRHSLMVVMNAVCDLEWDFKARFPEPHHQEGFETPPDLDESKSALVNHVLLCDVYTYQEMRPRFSGQADIWRRVQQNHDVRYHKFSVAPVGDAPEISLPAELLKDTVAENELPPGFMPAVFLDFKKTMTVSTSNLYAGLRNGGIERVSVVPPVYVHDLAQRFYSFMSRVGLPEA